MAYTETTSGANFSVAQAVTATANATNVFDITGAGVGNAPTMTGAGGLKTAIGSDIGAGDGMVIPEIIISNALTTAGTGSGTVTFSLQAAPDNGSFAEGTYYTLWTSGTFLGTAITAPFQFVQNVGPIPPGVALPRFYRLVYTVSGTFAATFNANLILNAPNVSLAKKYGNNLNDAY